MKPRASRCLQIAGDRRLVIFPFSPRRCAAGSDGFFQDAISVRVHVCAHVCVCVCAQSFTAPTDTLITQSGVWKHMKGYSTHDGRLALLSHTRTFPPTSSQSCTCSSSHLGSCSLSRFCNTVWCISAALSDICERAPTPPRLIVHKRVGAAFRPLLLPATLRFSLQSVWHPGRARCRLFRDLTALHTPICACTHNTTCLTVPI